MHIDISSFGMKVLKTWIYSGKRVYSTHEDIESSGEFGPRPLDPQVETEYFRLVPIDPEEVKRKVSVSQIDAQIEQIEDALIELQKEDAEKRAKLSGLKAERNSLHPAHRARK